MPARVLVVCTANICRSPAAALLLRRCLPGVEVVSRGVRAPEGAPACATTAGWLGRLGGGLDGHRAARLTEDDVRAATLVLTAGRRHRSEVALLRASAAVRTHTLAEAARLAGRLGAGFEEPGRGGPPQDGDASDRVLWLAEALYEARASGSGSAPAGGPAGDDLPDPHSGTPHAEVLPRLAAHVATLDAVLRGVAFSAPPSPPAGRPGPAASRRRPVPGRGER